MVRVLQIYRTYKTEQVGGVGEVMQLLAQRMGNYGVASEILTLSHHPDPPRTLDGEVPVHRYKIDVSVASNDFSFSALHDFSNLTSEFDVLHYHLPWPSGVLMHWLRRPTKPVLITYHSDIVRQKYLVRLYNPLRHWFLRNAQAIVATSPQYRDTSPVLQRYLAKTHVIPIGIEDGLKTPPTHEEIARMRARIGHERFFCFVGVLRYYKGLNFLMEANAGLDLPTVIAGSGPKERELKAQAAALGFKNTLFLGQISDAEKAALLYLCDGFLFPSHLRSEAFGISLLEAAMYGKPMISAEISTGSSYINQHGQTGLTVLPADPAALRDAMHYLWHHPQEGAQMGAAARKRYESHFTAEAMASSYAQLYRALLT